MYGAEREGGGGGGGGGGGEPQKPIASKAENIIT